MRAEIEFSSNFGQFPFIKVSHFNIVGGGSKHCLRAKKNIYTFLYGSLAQYKGQAEKKETFFETHLALPWIIPLTPKEILKKMILPLVCLKFHNKIYS